MRATKIVFQSNLNLIQHFFRGLDVPECGGGGIINGKINIATCK